MQIEIDENIKFELIGFYEKKLKEVEAQQKEIEKFLGQLYTVTEGKPTKDFVQVKEAKGVDFEEKPKKKIGRPKKVQPMSEEQILNLKKDLKPLKKQVPTFNGQPIDWRPDF